MSATGLCDGRFCSDELCPDHSEIGRTLAFARQYAVHDPDVEWPSDKHDSPIDAICAALDNLREKSASAPVDTRRPE